MMVPKFRDQMKEKIMGGKGGSYPSPPPVTRRDNSEIMNQMLDTIESLSAQVGENALPPPPEITPIPEPVVVDPVPSWQAQQAEIAAAVQQDFAEERKKKKGRTDTILTSPLLDLEEAETTIAALGV